MTDPGEPGPWEGAGDMPLWDRDPFETLVWVGRREDALRVIQAIIRDEAVGRVLCDGATIDLDRRDSADLQGQRREAEGIEKRLAGRPPAPSMPIVDHAIYNATRIANSLTRSGNSGPAASGGSAPGPPAMAVGGEPVEPPERIGSWRFEHRRGRAFFEDKRVKLTPIPYRIVHSLARARGPMLKIDLFKAVWKNNVPGESGVTSMFTNCRRQLREALGIPKESNPITSEGSGELATFDLDTELLRRFALGGN